MDPGFDEALTRLRRWEDAGGTWEVLSRHGDVVTISLCRCDGGEEMDRLASDDPGVLAYLGGRSRSDA